MSEPPVILDSSQVLLFANLDSSVTYTGLQCVIRGGRVIDPVPRLAVTQNLNDDGILLCHCDEEWNVLGVGSYPSVEKAQQIAERAYRGVTAKWRPFRKLTSDEIAEIEKIRKKLRSIGKRSGR